MAGEDEYITETMEYLAGLKTCDWCKHPQVKILPRIGLCSHCNRLRLELKRLETFAEAFQREHGGLTFEIGWDLRVQRAMIEDAKAEGQIYGDLYMDDISPLRLEHAFRALSGAYVGKDLFYGDANDLQRSLSPVQRRYIYYKLSLIDREHMRKNRRNRGMAMVQQATLDG